ncbi:2-oxo-4-hydroxy-4-carboxy-5-ureidoimidazoline decarboxylase [Georgenia satyanarayanai]|uniref:2-oxo-4-hydroxy-4-carboxy-5-ureidoimidazoline decarboxylase n=1 Tax=Georgenia satyanarayanai TaxID=860221 RepID=UPI002040B65D|nr:2-oxo-4-hydroxy-4-carboxy-5-ureidoimidazoline decarboxylase [Georgenia satyanarayanai]MCM3660611.1 2-oxo-4-hydroxy-4-carboxy-5-ureidoimidazoline decarboxylase [Georgenia satyanarayanai]
MKITTLDTFNTAPERPARDLLLACVAVPRWAEAIVAGRPYADLDALLRTARTAASPWTNEEIDAAMARHPRIGERATGEGADAEHSRREQSGVDTTDASTAQRLLEGNRAYEERFGHVFLIRAAGRSSADILAALEARLANDPDTERQITADQLREIAVLRLRGELS